MTEPADNRSKEIRANELLRAGRLAFTRGDRTLAHNLWRQAAALRPRDEQIWLALLQVVETEEDRRVCLENVIAINPQNVQAERQLNAIKMLYRAYEQDKEFAYGDDEGTDQSTLRRVLLLLLKVLILVLGVLAIIFLAVAGGTLISSLIL